jgi:type I restriction enzyme, R subunit
VFDCVFCLTDRSELVENSSRHILSPPFHDPPLEESDTRAKLIDPALHQRSWTEDFIRREETAGAIELINDKPRRRSKGFVDYTLRLHASGGEHPVAVALIEAKAETLPPGYGLDQAKGYARCKRMNVPFVFSSNGHQFVAFDRFTGLTSQPRLMSDFPTPERVIRETARRWTFAAGDSAA